MLVVVGLVIVVDGVVEMVELVEVVELVELVEVRSVVGLDAEEQPVRSSRASRTLEMSGAAAGPTDNEAEDETTHGSPDQRESLVANAVNSRGTSDPHDRR